MGIAAKQGFLVVGAGVLALLSVTGCSSLSVVRDLNDQRFTLDDQPVAHLSARVGGVYLLYVIPLVTGHSEKPQPLSLFPPRNRRRSSRSHGDPQEQGARRDSPYGSLFVVR